jgi:hypothetical protein
MRNGVSAFKRQHKVFVDISFASEKRLNYYFTTVKSPW